MRGYTYIALVGLVSIVGCGDDAEPAEQGTQAPEAEPPTRSDRVDSRPPPLSEPVPLWEGGETEREIDAANASAEGYLVVDVADQWTPYLFSERDNAEAEQVPNGYRETYLALARGEFPDNHHGQRARRDKYLELYGILPTLTVLRERMRTLEELECAESLDLTALVEFEGFVAYRNNDASRRDARRFGVVERQVGEIVRREGVESVDDLDRGSLSDRDQRRVRDFRADRAEVFAVRAAQDRLECEGFFEGKGRHVRGALDWSTHEAIAEFERRHRIYGWGFIGRDTLDALRRSPLENEREAVIRILTERAMHAAGIIEDGSTEQRDEARTYTGADGDERPIPNLEAQLRDNVIEAFGLQTPASTLAWLEALGELEEGERWMALTRPDLPEYYDADMDLFVEVDRGDVWYEFPYDATGQQRGQPVQRRPRLTVFTRYNDQRIPLARFGTTIGGWRSEYVEGVNAWAYKNSPVGPRVWHQIVASPVWLPPESTPPRSLLSRNPRGRGEERFHIDYHETGPSYASAYGLVAAYHLRYRQNSEGEIEFGGDEGIRTHGSVDYMSIMRRQSHGCHRLHNHIAVRLMSFVLAHRPHRRVGQQEMAFRRIVPFEGHEYRMEIDSGGYVFQLEQPVRVNVLEGRVRGRVHRPIDHHLPKFDEELGAYVLPDGGVVAISPAGQMSPSSLPDAGPPDAGAWEAHMENLPNPYGDDGTRSPPPTP